MNMSMGVGMFGDGGGEWEREGMRGGLEERLDGWTGWVMGF
jgi:hypothetical protein